MREQYLLDSNVLLWLNLDPGRIAGAIIAELDAAEAVYFSAASAWELAIKQSLGKLRMTGSISAFVAKAGLLEIAVTTKFAEAAAQLPMHHRDPFDRIIVAQARGEGLTLITSDRRLANYDVKILRA
ncbi:MAG: type II toxin-antitoxin system VapC family toxin [Acidobacteriaceae bacterium]